MDDLKAAARGVTPDDIRAIEEPDAQRENGDPEHDAAAYSPSQKRKDHAA